MRKPRFVVEGTWSGYRYSQSRTVHRVIVKDPEPYLGLMDIHFTDGTRLSLSVRECAFKERVQEIHGYDQLISDCLRYRVNSVSALIEARKQASQ